MKLEEGYYWIKVSYFQRQLWEIAYWNDHWRLVDEHDDLDPNRVLKIGLKIEPPTD